MMLQCDFVGNFQESMLANRLIEAIKLLIRINCGFPPGDISILSLSLCSQNARICLFYVGNSFFPRSRCTNFRSWRSLTCPPADKALSELNSIKKLIIEKKNTNGRKKFAIKIHRPSHSSIVVSLFRNKTAMLFNSGQFKVLF